MAHQPCGIIVSLAGADAAIWRRSAGICWTHSDSSPDKGTEDDDNETPPEVQPQFPAEESGGEARQVGGGAHPHEEHDSLVGPIGIGRVAVLRASAFDAVRLDAELAIEGGLEAAQLGEDALVQRRGAIGRAVVVTGPRGGNFGPGGVLLLVLHLGRNGGVWLSLCGGRRKKMERD